MVTELEGGSGPSLLTLNPILFLPHDAALK